MWESCATVGRSRVPRPPHLIDGIDTKYHGELNGGASADTYARDSGYDGGDSEAGIRSWNPPQRSNWLPEEISRFAVLLSAESEAQWSEDCC